MNEILTFRLKNADRAVCGQEREPMGAMTFAPCSEPAGHPTGVHYFEAEPSGTLALLFVNASVDMADHLTACDACASLDGPLCLLGEMRVDVLLDLGQQLKGQRLGRRR